MQRIFRGWRRGSAGVYAVAVGALVLLGCGKSSPPAGPDESRPASTPSPSAETPVRAAMAKALWVSSAESVTNDTARSELFDLCRAQGIDILFYPMDHFANVQYHRPYLAHLDAFVRSVHDHGLRIHAVRPVPMEPDLQDQQEQYAVVTYIRDFLVRNRQQEPSTQFDGCLLDFDPTQSAGWAENEGGIQEVFVEFVRELRRTFIEFQQPLPFGWSIPRGFSAYDRVDAIYEVLNYVVLNDAYDSADALAAAASRVLELAVPSGTEVYIGVETRNLLGLELGEASQTFFEEGADALQAALETLPKALRGNPVFRGVAIRDADGLRVL